MSAIRMGVISDTHFPERVPYTMLERILPEFEGCDCILHAGDIETRYVLERLSTIAPVYAVRGDDEIDTLQLPKKRIITVGGVRIGLHHSHRPKLVEMRHRLASLLSPRQRHRMNWSGIHNWLLDEFREDRVQVIVFGHFHVPYSAHHNGILLFNPGSIYKLSRDTLAYRITHSRYPLRRLTARVEYHLKSSTQATPLPTVGFLTIMDQEIEAEHRTLPPISSLLADFNSASLK